MKEALRSNYAIKPETIVYTRCEAGERLMEKEKGFT